jgi:VWFA-related protein
MFRPLLSTASLELGGYDSSPRVSCFYFFVSVFLVLWATLASGQASPETPSPLGSPPPTARIELSAAGYRTPSRMDRLTRNEASESLDFVDENHVLLTFDPKKLFKRLPGCTPDHQDRIMHAAILELPSGRVVKEADWNLHDRRRYLWPLGSGTFLLRKLNDLYIVDSNLQEQLLLSSPKPLLWVSVTPGGGQIIVETANEAGGATAKAPSPGSPSAPKPKFVARFLDAKTLTPRRTVPLDQVVDLNGTNTGYVDLLHKGDIWLIRFGPSPSQRNNIARVRSRTVPDVVYAGNHSLLIGRCATVKCDYSVTSFSVTGRRLWRQHWSRFRYYPAVARDLDSSRFGVSSLQILPLQNSDALGTPAYDPDDPLQADLSQPDIFQQDIQIFETASGSPVLSLTVTPAVLNGQNFSLSPDARRVAVLEGDALELYDLPQVSRQEEAKLAQLKTEEPDLFSVAPPGSASASAAPISQLHNEKTATSTADAAVGSAAPVRSSATDDPDADAGKYQISSTDQSSAGSSAPVLTEQELEAKAGPVPIFKVSTRAVVVDVVVTDSKGHPIKGLKEQDFHVTEDGKPQQLRSFQEFSDAELPAVPAPTPASTQKPEPNSFSNETAAPDPGSLTMVLFDLLNTPTQDQVYARHELIKFLESKPKSVQFAFCTLSAEDSRLRLIQGFTQDEAVLLAAARGKDKKATPQEVRWQSSAVATANSVGIVGDLAKGGPSSGFQNLLGTLQGMQAEQRGTDSDDRVSATLDSFMQLARYLSGIPGRKNVVWLSGSFPIFIAAPEGPDDSAADNRSYSTPLKVLSNLLAEAQVAVYPVDVRGLVADGLSAENVGSDLTPLPEMPNSTPQIMRPLSPARPRRLDELDEQSTEREALNRMAIATGGQAFYNSNGIRDAIATAVEQGSNYYALSYTPSNQTYNGKFRKIRVLLGEKRYTLHHRRGYFAENANAPAQDADLVRRTRAAAMQHGSPPSRQILFSAEVAPVGAKTTMNHYGLGEVLLASTKKPVLPTIVEVQHYSIDYSLQASQLQFMPQQNATYRSVLTLMVASFDSQGTMLTGSSYVGISNLESSVYKDVIGGTFTLHQEADVPTEATWLRIGIQDQMSGRIGTVEIPLPVPQSPKAVHRIKHTLPEIEPD